MQRGDEDTARHASSERWITDGYGSSPSPKLVSSKMRKKKGKEKTCPDNPKSWLDMDNVVRMCWTPCLPWNIIRTWLSSRTTFVEKDEQIMEHCIWCYFKPIDALFQSRSAFILPNMDLLHPSWPRCGLDCGGHQTQMFSHHWNILQNPIKCWQGKLSKPSAFQHFLGNCGWPRTLCLDVKWTDSWPKDPEWHVVNDCGILLHG